MVKPILRHEGVLEYRHKTQTHKQFDLKWQFVFRNASEKELISLKRIIHILTVFISRKDSFRPVQSDLI